MTGSPWAALDRLRNSGTRNAAERAALLAAVRWANADGVLWPPLDQWAALAGVKVRTLQRSLRSLAERGLVEVVSASPGGSRKTSRYRVPLLTRNPDKPSGMEPRPGKPPTPTAAPTIPDGDDAKPRQGVGLTAKNPQSNPQQQPAAADVFSRLGIQNLRDHPNATPERAAWIEREASKKAKPAGWAATCIREGWPVPEPTEAEARATRAKVRAAQLAQFDTLPAEERSQITALMRRKYPNLSNYADDAPVVRAAVVGVWLGMKSESS